MKCRFVCSRLIAIFGISLIVAGCDVKSESVSKGTDSNVDPANLTEVVLNVTGMT
jgi:uncharacterized membrane protein